MNLKDKTVMPKGHTIAEARTILGVGNTSVWKLIKEGKLKTVRIGRRRIVLSDSIDRVLTPED